MNNGAVSDPPLRRNWRFQFLWAGAGFSYLGDAAINLALPFLIVATGGSPALAGLATTVSLATGIVVAAPAGVWVDRMDRRRILLLAELVQALAWGTFAVLVHLDAVVPWTVVLVAALSGGAGAFTGPATASAIQALVPKSQLAAAYAQVQARAYAIQLGGPPLGGLLYGIGRAVPFAFQVFASAVSVVCYIAAKVPRRPVTGANPAPPDGAPPPPRRSRVAGMREDLLEAFRWLFRQRGLRAVLGVAVFMNPLVNAIWVPVIVLVGERGGASLDTGVIMAGVGVGGLIGSLLSTRLCAWVPAGRLVLLVGFLMGASYCLIPLPLGVQWPIVPVIVSCLASPALNVALMALIGHIVPGSMMGRMSSVLSVSFQGLSPLGPVIGGLLAATLGGAGALVVCGVSLLVVTAAAAASRDLRNLRVPGDPPPDSAEPAGTEEPEDDPGMNSRLREEDAEPEVVAHRNIDGENTPCATGLTSAASGENPETNGRH